jgi:PKD domain
VRHPLLVLLLTALLAAPTTTLVTVTPAQATRPAVGTETDVRGDDERDAYVGSGGLILPASVEQATRQQVASCLGCQWRLTTPCAVPGPGNAFDGEPTCLSVVRGCPGGRLLRTWFQGAGQAWREIGLACIPPGGPLTVSEVGREVRAAFERGIPALAPRFQPTQGILTQIPVVFDSGQQAGGRTWLVELLGREVALTATPAWSWRFGDGAWLDTLDPGGRYPQAGVAHVYRRVGTYQVACTATWSATFVVDGLGPFAVREPVTQTQVRRIEVGEGRALLAPARPPG